MRVVVVGASSGLGRCIGIGLAQGGAEVALLARRHDLLVEAAKEAGPGTLAISCDVTDEASCKAAISEAAQGLGGIDALIYATGVGHLAKLVDIDAATWRHALDTNVVGAALVTAATVPHLTASAGVAVYLSSVSASQTAPWPGLGSYAVSKAALDKLVDAWRGEVPSVGFTRIVVGDCAGGEGPGMTQFTNGWDMELMGEVYPTWLERNYLAGNLLEVDELLRVIDFVVTSGAGTSIPSLIVTPRSAASISEGVATIEAVRSARGLDSRA
jgi:NAD(P)-dependent dehydrogenase (short-subunit alcohol dehydrogenase family)